MKTTVKGKEKLQVFALTLKDFSAKHSRISSSANRNPCIFVLLKLLIMPDPIHSLKKVSLPVTGMSCVNCAANIERNVKKLNGIEDANVDFSGEKLNVIFDPGRLKEADIIECIQKIGFGVASGKVEIPLENLTDQNEAIILERRLEGRDGILHVTANVATSSLMVEFIPGISGVAEILQVIQESGFKPISSDPEEIQEDSEDSARQKYLARQKRLMAGSLALALPMILYHMLHSLNIIHLEFDNILMFTLATIVQFYYGWSFYNGAFRSLRAGIANMDVLIMLGSSAAYFSSVFIMIGILPGDMLYFEAGASIIALIRLGKYLETRARSKTSESLKSLMELQVREARIEKDGVEVVAPVGKISLGDLVVVRPGEKFPVDGIIRQGTSSANESMISGETMPVNKNPGDEVIGSTINLDGLIRFEATRVGKNTTLANIIRMVREAQSGKAPVQEITDKISRWFVPIVILIALITGFSWLFLIGSAWQIALINAVSVVVIACPCALGLATPTAIVAGTSLAAKHGILFRNATALEMTGKVKTLFFDKTGTITTGKPTISGYFPGSGITDEELLRLAATAEQGSEHPLAKAVVLEAKKKNILLDRTIQFKNFPGTGVKTSTENTTIWAGNKRLMQNLEIDPEILSDFEQRVEQQGNAVIYIAVGDEQSPPVLMGCLAIEDQIRSEAEFVVHSLLKKGIHLGMITGDHQMAASIVAKKVGIERFDANVLPGDKASVIRQENEKNDKVRNRNIIGMVGDGINDAPSLATADVGFALGTGTDVAMSTAGVTLISGDLRGILKAMEISRKTWNVLLQNLGWALIYNVILIPVAALGLLSPILAAAAMSFSSLFVITNSLLLNSRYHPKPDGVFMTRRV